MPELVPRHKRLLLVAALLLGASLALFLLLQGLATNVTYFYAPSEYKAAENELRASAKTIRVGGLVEEGSIQREEIMKDGVRLMRLRFTITDLKEKLAITYDGVPPDLFREGQGVVAEGLPSRVSEFHATILLAKHDENYMPPEVAKTLKDKHPQYDLDGLSPEKDKAP